MSSLVPGIPLSWPGLPWLCLISRRIAQFQDNQSGRILALNSEKNAPPEDLP